MLVENYIKGLVVFYKGSELVDMSSRAVKYHDEKANEYRKMAKDYGAIRQGELQNLTPEAQEYHRKSSTSHVDPVVTAENDAARHERQKRMHEHLRDHYDKEARYGLSIEDLGIYGLTRH